MPLEGVSFISFSGGLAGFVLSLISLFLFHFIPREVANFRRDFFGMPDSETLLTRHRLKTNLVFLALMTLGYALLISMEIGASYLFLKPEDRRDAVSVAFGTGSAAVFLLLIGLIAINFHASDRPWKRGIFWLFVFAVVAALFASLTSPFASYLRTIRYGGGLQVELDIEGADRVSACLLLISDEVITVYDEGTTGFVEIPRTTVSRFSYNPIDPPCELPFPYSPAHKAQTPTG